MTPLKTLSLSIEKEIDWITILEDDKPILEFRWNFRAGRFDLAFESSRGAYYLERCKDDYLRDYVESVLSQVKALRREMDALSDKRRKLEELFKTDKNGAYN